MDDRLEHYLYDLPSERIAQAPAQPRHSARLLHLHEEIDDRVVSQLPEMLESGDLLVVNNSRVVPARLFGTKPSGGKIELLLLSPENEERNRWHVMTRGRKIRDHVVIGDHSFPITRPREGRAVLEGDADLLRSLAIPAIPPYINSRYGEDWTAADYQTRYADPPGSIAAPTSGLHFSDQLLEQLQNRGVRSASITLHVGPGTFQPVRAESVTEHEMEGEWASVSSDVFQAIQQTLDAGSRVVVVGTTTMRALEGASLSGTDVADDGFEGVVDLFIRPGHRFAYPYSALWTNFHISGSTLVMLVAAFAGRERVLNSYAHAIALNYRFHSFGDAMLVTPTWSNEW